MSKPADRVHRTPRRSASKIRPAKTGKKNLQPKAPRPFVTRYRFSIKAAAKFRPHGGTSPHRVITPPILKPEWPMLRPFCR